MKTLSLFLVLLFSNSLFSQELNNNQVELSETTDENYQLTITKKNAIYMGYNHGLAGVAYHRNYYNYATAYLFTGKRYNPGLTGIAAGVEWTLSPSTLNSGWYISPSAIYFKTGADNQLGPNDSYAELYGVSLKENEAALGLSLSITHKWVFLNSDRKSVVFGLGTEFLRVRSNIGLGLVSNLGIIF